MEDEALLLAWANDPDVRRMSRRQARIAPDAHRAWFAGRFADPTCRIWIAEEDGAPAGQVRLDRSGNAAEIDISVAAERRGRGIGLYLLTAPELVDWPGLERLDAWVRYDNDASLALFRRAGFSQRDADSRFLHFEKWLGRAATG